MRISKHRTLEIQQAERRIKRLRERERSLRRRIRRGQPDRGDIRRLRRTQSELQTLNVRLGFLTGGSGDITARERISITEREARIKKRSRSATRRELNKIERQQEKADKLAELKSKIILKKREKVANIENISQRLEQTKRSAIILKAQTRLSTARAKNRPPVFVDTLPYETQQVTTQESLFSPPKSILDIDELGTFEERRRATSKKGLQQRAAFLFSEGRRARERFLTGAKESGTFAGKASAFIIETATSPLDIAELAIVKPKVGVPLGAATIILPTVAGKLGGKAVKYGLKTKKGQKIAQKLLRTAQKAKKTKTKINKQLAGVIINEKDLAGLGVDLKGQNVKITYGKLLGIKKETSTRTFVGKGVKKTRSYQKPVIGKDRKSILIKEGVLTGKRLKVKIKQKGDIIGKDIIGFKTRKAGVLRGQDISNKIIADTPLYDINKKIGIGELKDLAGKTVKRFKTEKFGKALVTKGTKTKAKKITVRQIIKIGDPIKPKKSRIIKTKIAKKTYKDPLRIEIIDKKTRKKDVISFITRGEKKSIAEIYKPVKYKPPTRGAEKKLTVAQLKAAGKTLKDIYEPKKFKLAKPKKKKVFLFTQDKLNSIKKDLIDIYKPRIRTVSKAEKEYIRRAKISEGVKRAKRKPIKSQRGTGETSRLLLKDKTRLLGKQKELPLIVTEIDVIPKQITNIKGLTTGGRIPLGSSRLLQSGRTVTSTKSGVRLSLKSGKKLIPKSKIKKGISQKIAPDLSIKAKGKTKTGLIFNQGLSRLTLPKTVSKQGIKIKQAQKPKTRPKTGIKQKTTPKPRIKRGQKFKRGGIKRVRKGGRVRIPRFELEPVSKAKKKKKKGDAGIKIKRYKIPTARDILGAKI